MRLLCEHTGYSPEDMHEIVKHKFLKRTIWLQHNTDGVKEMQEITKSTTSLSTAEMEKFLSDIRAWASFCLGVNIPEPNECPLEAYQ